MKRKILMILVILLSVSLFVTNVEAQISISCNYIESNSDQFWIDESYWNETSGEWEAPLWYQYWSNATYGPHHLVVPPIENQTKSFNYSVEVSEKSTIWIAIYGMNNFDSRDYYEGPTINHSSWLATNGVVINTNGPYEDNETITLEGVLENYWFNRTDWYKIKIRAEEYFKSWVFFLNTTDGSNQIYSGTNDFIFDDVSNSFRNVFSCVVEFILLPVRFLHSIL